MHSKRFFRVILRSIDPDRESPDSFALKLSMRTHTSLPRVRQVVRRLPCTVKQGVSVAQANKLKVLIEALGGRVRVESYLVTPGIDEPTASGPVVHLGQDEPEVTIELRNCPDCGTPLEEASGFCSFCQKRTRLEGDVPEDAPEDVPGERPIESDEIVVEDPARAPLDIVKMLRENKFLIAAGILVILLVITIIKQ